jgi:hypothetical protein
MMSIESIIGVAVIAGAGWVVWKMLTKGETVQQAAAEAAAEVKAEVAKVADVNGDGKVDMADAVEAVKKTRGAAKKAAGKVKAAAKKTKKAKA